MKKLPRMTDWLLLALILLLFIFAVSPHQLPVALFKMALIAIAGVVGYWLDRSLFPYARPDTFQEVVVEEDDIEDSDVLRFDLEVATPNDFLFAVSMLRRALIVAAAMIAVGLGN